MNKEQLVKWGAFVLGAVIIVGVIVSLIFLASNGEMLDGSVSMGDVLVAQSTNNDLVFYDKEGQRLYEEVSINGDYVVLNNNATAIYVLKKGTPNSVTRVWLEGETLKTRELYTFEKEISEDTEIKWAVDFGAMFDKANNEFTIILPEFFETKTIAVDADKPVESWQITDENIYYAQNKVIYRMDYEGNVVSKTSVEEPTIDLQLQLNKVIAISDFGSGNSEKTLLTLNNETLEIENLNMIEGDKVSSYPRLMMDDSIYLLIDGESFKSINTSNVKKTNQLPQLLGEMKWIFFGNRFTYTIDKDGNAFVYQTRNSQSSFNVNGSYKLILPLYATEPMVETTDSNE